MSNPSEIFNNIADAVNRDGNTPAHQEAALAAQLYGAAFGSMFDCFKKARDGDNQQQQQQQRRGRGREAGGGPMNPIQSAVFATIGRMTDQEMQRIQRELDTHL